MDAKVIITYDKYTNKVCNNLYRYQISFFVIQLYFIDLWFFYLI